MVNAIDTSKSVNKTDDDAKVRYTEGKIPSTTGLLLLRVRYQKLVI